MKKWMMQRTILPLKVSTQSVPTTHTLPYHHSSFIFEPNSLPSLRPFAVLSLHGVVRRRGDENRVPQVASA